ncbi:hypothetical protein BC835DRAFT_1524995, partial [Cytidiella melzeri]
MDPYEILNQQLSPEAAAALNQLLNDLTTRLQVAQQTAQDAQNSLLTQQQFEQSITNALSQTQFTVQAPTTTAAPPAASRGTLRIALQRY